ncbi:MAG: hypothetical protein IBJ15_00235 [Alphaproteobacteria bacterium]|nr:hypothetical protein [Alphaproteobacteria bacterium]
MGNPNLDAKPACKDCRFFGSNIELDQCRRYPPTVHDGEARFPLVRGTAWCGEFRLPELSPRFQGTPSVDFGRGSDVKKAFASLMATSVDDLDAAATRIAFEIVPDSDLDTEKYWQGMARKLLVPLLAIHVGECRSRFKAADRESFLDFISTGLGIPVFTLEAHAIEVAIIKNEAETRRMLVGLSTAGSSTKAQRDALRETVEFSPAILSNAMFRLVMHVRHGR